MLFHKIGTIVILSVFSVFIYLNIIINTSNNILINYYQSVLLNLTSNFDYKLTYDLIQNPSKSNPVFNEIKSYLLEFSNNLGINDIYLSTIDAKENHEIMLVHVDDTEFEVGQVIYSQFGIDAFKNRKVLSGNLKNKRETFYSFYSPILNENGGPIALISFNIPRRIFTQLTLTKFVHTLLSLAIINIVLITIYIVIATTGLWRILRPIYVIKNEVLRVSNKIFSINRNLIFPTHEFNLIQKLLVKSVNMLKDFILYLVIYLEYIRFSISKVKIGSIDMINKIKSSMAFITKVSKSNENVNVEVFKLKEEIEIFSEDISVITTEIKKILESNTSAIEICQNNNEFLNEFLLEISMLINKLKNEQIECKNLTILSNKINDILTNILTITNETKLLSLNASIVAISAGEHGKSFGVIAKEVGDLSQNIIKSTGYIQQTLIKISNTINLLNKESIEVFESFKQHSDKSRIFSSNLSEIYNSIKNITLYLKDISFSSEKLNSKNEIILDNVTFLSSNSSSNLNSIRQIENLISRVNENTLAFRESFEDLDSNITQIKLNLSQFKL